MRTIQQYINWMKFCQKLDPDCTYLVHHNYRKDRGTRVDLEEAGATPLKSFDVGRKLYLEGPQGLLDLDNGVLYIGDEKERLEKLLERVGFEVNEKIQKRNTKTIFDDVAVFYTRYEHRRGIVSVQFFYGSEGPILCANIKTREGTTPVSFYKILEEVKSGEAELTFNGCILLNHYGKKPFKPGQSRFEEKKADEVGMRDNTLPLLEAIVQSGIPALLKPKGVSPTLLNLQ